MPQRGAGGQPDGIRRDRTRDRTIAAAHALFAEQGYRATTTKQISARAGIAEPTLFRNFGSKAELFESTIIEPFTAFISTWTTGWRNLSTEDPLPELAEGLVRGLLLLARENQRLLVDLMTARTDPQNDLHASAVSISHQIRDGLRAVQDVGLEIAATRGLDELDPPATISAVASMVLGSVLLEDWTVPSGTRTPSQARMIREMTQLITGGVAHRTA